MHTVDLVVVCTALVVIVLFAAVLARQRQLLRTTGAVPLALQRGSRWLYGIGRYVGDEFRWYRALGVATRPTLILRRGQVRVLEHRSPEAAEVGALPASAIVVRAEVDGRTVCFALGDGAYTGFVSWVESSAPR